MILYLLVILLKTLFGWSVPAIILVVGLTTCVYSMFGGVLAVIWMGDADCASLRL